MDLCSHSPWRDCRDDVDVGDDLVAVVFQRQVVDLCAEGVFDLVADVEEAEDDVGGCDADGYAYPAGEGGELEGERQEVYPCDLADCDLVGERHGSSEYTVGCG